MEDNIEDNIEQYLLNGGELFTILSIDSIHPNHPRDGGTQVLNCGRTHGDKKFYIHHTNFTIHSEYPLSNENVVKNIYTNSYIIDRLNKYLKDLKSKLDKVESTIYNLSLQGKRDRKISEILNEKNNIL